MPGGRSTHYTIAPTEHTGTAGTDHVWYSDRQGTLHLLHAPGRRAAAAIALGEFRHPANAIAVSRDGQRLDALAPGASGSYEHEFLSHEAHTAHSRRLAHLPLNPARQ